MTQYNIGSQDLLFLLLILLKRDNHRDAAIRDQVLAAKSFLIFSGL